VESGELLIEITWKLLQIYRVPLRKLTEIDLRIFKIREQIALGNTSADKQHELNNLLDQRNAAINALANEQTILRNPSQADQRP